LRLVPKKKRRFWNSKSKSFLFNMKLFETKNDMFFFSFFWRCLRSKRRCNKQITIYQPQCNNHRLLTDVIKHNLSGGPWCQTKNWSTKFPCVSCYVARVQVWEHGSSDGDRWTSRL
jgi:hypothetical protein